MIPILYDKTETTFATNGLGRLRDCISCEVTEERNGIYELDFEYPVTGAHYDDIQIGRIVGVTHDDTGDIQPFDIVSYSKPIDGVVTFHCTHISYRQSYMTVTGSNINSLADAFTLFASAEPTNPFSYQTDKTSTGYLASADGIPRTVRQMLGGIEGSVLDAYGGEYEWDKWTVYLHSSRGVQRDFSIRYGVNMLDFNDDTDSQGAYQSVVPYWTDGTDTIVGDRVDSNGTTITGHGECVPLDVSDKFESKPTKAQVEAMAGSMIGMSYLPAQTIEVSFVRLQDLGYSEFENLYRCNLCDTINVIFPDYGTNAYFKIVKTVWNVLLDRYDEMELGTLSTTLSEALGIENKLDNSITASQFGIDDYIISKGTSGSWRYIKYHSGLIEAWYSNLESSTFTSSNFGAYRGSSKSVSLPNLGQTSIQCIAADGSLPNTGFIAVGVYDTSSVTIWPYNRTQLNTATDYRLFIHVVMI